MVTLYVYFSPSFKFKDTFLGKFIYFIMILDLLVITYKVN
jgi:hypothetical protein